MKCYIIYEKYYDFDNHRVLTGGVQTYCTNLIPLLRSLAYECVIYQMGSYESEIDLEYAKVYSVKVDFRKGWRYNSKKLLERFFTQYNDAEDLLLFATDTLICQNKASRSLAIQHGICWDIPTHQLFSPKLNSIYAFSKVRSSFEFIRHLNYVKKVVCVDYNFPNWYRATTAYEAVPLEVVPNFAEVGDFPQKPEGVVNLIFARRFEWYRGTRLFASAARRILDECPQVKVTIAGRGPDEAYLKEQFSDYGDRVLFTQYIAEESAAVHSDMHIAVIPTVGSEGTSLSLLEAMAAGCAIVCTNVGGMTNIVLDGYNGLMISPDADVLYRSMKQLVENDKLRKQLAQNAYETVKMAFSFEKWKIRWLQILKEI